MDGDIAPIHDMIDAIEGCDSMSGQSIALVVDEAHSTGVIGNFGEGLVQHLGLQSKVYARLHTFGKAVGCHGGKQINLCVLLLIYYLF
jgi:8-amino-7-oxononanoate synthase